MVDLDKRRHIIGFASTVTLAACGGDIVSFIDQAKRSEKLHRIPGMGDVIVDGIGQPYRLIFNTKYPIPNLQKFFDNTKTKPQVLEGTPEVRDALGKYPTGHVSQEKTIFILGDEKRNKPMGGELNCYAGGALTEDGIPPTGIIRPKDLFVRTKSRMEKNGFTEFDNFFFPWGNKNLATYSSLDTIKDPEKSVNDFIEYTELLIREFPLCQQNWDFHSLPGTIAMVAFIKRPDLLAVVNNLHFESSPVRGVDPLRKFVFDRVIDTVVSQYPQLRSLLKDEKVSKFLADLWNSGHHRKVDELGKTMAASGKGLINAGTKDDPFAPEDLRKIEEAEIITIITRGFDIRDPLSYLDAHGAVLKSDTVIERKAQKIGQNLVPLT